MLDARAFVRQGLGGLRGLRPEREADVVEELALQVEAMVDEAVRGGLDPGEAEAVVRARFTSADWERLVREIEGAARPAATARRSPGNPGAGLMGEFRFAARQALRNPAMTTAAVLTLALAIGANTAIFSVVNAVLVQPLPYPAADRMVSVETRKEGSPELEAWSSLPDVLDLGEKARTLEMLTAISPLWNHTLEFDGEAEHAQGLSVSASFAGLTGARLVAGRFFGADEDRPGGARVAVISQRLAERRYGSAGGALGRGLRLEGMAYTISGVMAADFEWLGEPLAASAGKVDVWTPIRTSMLGDRPRSMRWTKPVARLKPGVARETAEQELRAISAGLAAQYPGSNAGFVTGVRLVKDVVTGTSRTPLAVLLVMAGFVLLVACGNVANLLLAKAVGRRREIAMRIALGASGWRVVRQLLVETLLLAVAGSVVGAVIASGLLAYLLEAFGTAIPRSAEIRPDWMVLAFMAFVSLLSAVLAGTAPAWQVLRWPAMSGLREGERGSTGKRGLAPGLAAAQVAISLVLLTTAALLARSFIALMNVDPGFAAREVLSVSTKLPPGMSPADRLAMAKRLEERLRAIPGVQAAGAASRMPLQGSNIGSWLTVEGRQKKLVETPEVEYRIASRGYFAAMGMPLRAGRWFDDADERNPASVILINQALATQHFPGEDPVGRRVQLGEPGNSPWIRIVGVVGDIRHFGIDATPRPEIYRPYPHNPLMAPIFAVRTTGDPGRAAAEVRAAIREVNRGIPVYNEFAMQDLVERSALRRKAPAFLAGGFAVLTVLIAAVGLAGVVMNAVRQRRRELGVRLALGSTTGQAIGLLMRENLRIVVIGGLAGLPVAVLLARGMGSMLYGTSPWDPLVWVGAVLAQALVAAVACWIPARLAASIHPAEALRGD